VGVGVCVCVCVWVGGCVCVGGNLSYCMQHRSFYGSLFIYALNLG
jgi:hypothetical protein